MTDRALEELRAAWRERARYRVIKREHPGQTSWTRPLALIELQKS